MAFFVRCCLLFVFVWMGVYAQVSLPDTLFAHRALKDAEIILDGNLQEDVWKSARKISNFTQRELKENEPATEKTEIAVVYTESSLYLGVWCFDSEPDKLIHNQLQRDFQWWTEDNLNIIIDTYNDKRNGYLFVTNPNGARADALVTGNGAGFNTDWNGVWDCRATITSNGWFAEIQIPFNTLKFADSPDMKWGINFERNIRRKREQVQWQGWARDAEINNVSRAGTLAGLNGITSVNLVELKPYAIGGTQFVRNASTSFIRNAGLDINYLVTPTIKLNFTANTDFAQAEADRIQVNITRFGQFFPEKREFFLEGRDFFDFGLDGVTGFYSRRIGIPYNSSFAEPVPIVAGARALGKVDQSTFGFMSIQTDKRGDSVPSINYSALSYRHDVLENSFVSFNATSKIEPTRSNFFYGTQLDHTTTKFLGDKNFTVGGAFAQSYTTDAAEKHGSAHRVYVFYPNNIINANASWQRASKDVNPEMGFFARSNYQSFNARAEYRPRPEWLPWVQYVGIKPLDINYFINDETKQFESLNYDIRPFGIVTKSGEWFEVGYSGSADKPAYDFTIGTATNGNDIVIPAGEYWYQVVRFNYETFNARMFSISGETRIGTYYNGKGYYSWNEAVWRTGKYVQLSAEHEVNNILFPDGRLVTHNIGTRVRFATSPFLFGSLLTQWASTGDQVFLNFRVNWIPILGADVFFVVNQAINTGSVVSLGNTSVVTKAVWRFVL